MSKSGSEIGDYREIAFLDVLFIWGCRIVDDKYVKVSIFGCALEIKSVFRWSWLLRRV